MANKKAYEDMSYEELEAEKHDIEGQINELKSKTRALAKLMDAKQGEVKLKTMVDKLSPDEKAQVKEML